MRQFLNVRRQIAAQSLNPRVAYVVKKGVLVPKKLSSSEVSDSLPIEESVPPRDLTAEDLAVDSTLADAETKTATDVELLPDEAETSLAAPSDDSLTDVQAVEPLPPGEDVKPKKKVPPPKKKKTVGTTP